MCSLSTSFPVQTAGAELQQERGPNLYRKFLIRVCNVKVFKLEIKKINVKESYLNIIFKLQNNLMQCKLCLLIELAPNADTGQSVPGQRSKSGHTLK